MTRIERDEFRRLAQTATLDLRQPTPELSGAMADLGVSEADLRVGNGDSVIAGEEEFSALHDRLVELDQTRPAQRDGVQIDRAAQLYQLLSGHADVGPRVVEQAAPRGSATATAREALALRSFQNLRDAGFLNEAEGYGGALPAAPAERFAVDFPTAAAALRGRAPTYRDLFQALSQDHDRNGTMDLRVDALMSRGLFGEPPVLNEEEATAVLLGRDGRGATRDTLVDQDASGTPLTDRRGRATEVGRQVDRLGRRSGLRVADRPEANTDSLARTRTQVLLRRGEVGRDTLVRELSAHPNEIRNLGLALLGANAEMRGAALEVCARLSVSDSAEARSQGAALLDQLEHLYPAATVATSTVAAAEAGAAERLATMRDLRLESDRLVDRVYGNARTGRGGIRATTEGAAQIPSVHRQLRQAADGVRASLAQNASAIQRLEVLRGRVADGTPEAADLDRGLAELHQERVTLLEAGARISDRLERVAGGLADDTGWVRASYAAGDRRGALDDAGRLARELRGLVRDETSAIRMGAAATSLDADHLAAIDQDLERTIVSQQVHLRAFGARLRSARGNDQYRLDVLSATRDTLGLIRSDFPSSPEVARAARLGDVDAQAEVAADRAEELTALGVDPADPRWEGKTTLEVIVALAKNGDLTAAARLTQVQSALAGTIEEATGLLREHQATPAQLEAMGTLREYVAHYNFARPEDLASFDLADLETRFTEQLAAAGLHGIVPSSEIDRMQQIHDEAQQFTLLTDLSAGVLDPGGELSRDENAARVLARDAAMRDPNHAYAVVRQQTSSGILFRVRQLSAADEAAFRSFATERGADADAGNAAPFGSVYVARRSDSGIQETDRYGSYSTDPAVAAFFRPTSEGGPPVSDSPSLAQESEMYRSIHDRAAGRVADRYRAALRTFEQNGVGEHPNRATFDRSITTLVAGLKAQTFDPPTVREHNRDVPKGEIELRQVLQLYGADAEGAVEMAHALWTGETTATELFSGTDPMGTPYVTSHEYNVRDRLYASAQGTRRRFAERLAEVTAPYAGSARDVGAGREQVFDLFREFPDLADEFYRQQGFTSLTGFPPQTRPGTSPGSAAERSFLEAATAWQDHEETMGYLKMGGVIALGILVTVGTGGLAGPEAAMIAGVIFAAGASMPEVVSSVESLGRAQDARRVGAASDQTVHFRENEVTGAVAGLYINVLTAGLTAGTAGNVTRAGARALLREAVRDTLIGAGSGALTTALNPNVWESDNTAGLILKGAIVGGVGGAVGWGAGRGVQSVGRRIAVAFPRPVDGSALRVGSSVDVAIEGMAQPERWRVARLNSESGMLTLEREGRQIEVSIREAQRVSVDPDSPLAAAMRAGHVDEHGAPLETGTTPPARAPGEGGIVAPPTEPPPSGPVATRPSAPPRAPAAAESARITDGPSEAFAQRVAQDHPLVAEAVSQIRGTNARELQLRALGAAERNPAVRSFIEANGRNGARLVGELGEFGFMRAAGERGHLPFEFDRVLEARPEETLRLARDRPDDFRALLEGLDRSHDIGGFAREFGVAKGAQLARIQAASPEGVELLLGQPGGRQRLADALGRSREEAVALATAAQDRSYRAPDGRLLERGPPPEAAPTPSRASLEALADRAGVDPAVLDNPSAHPVELARLVEQMRSELPTADRAALDLEMAGRRMVDAQHYGPAREAGVLHPEQLYGAAAFQAWSRAEASVMGAARRGQPLTVELLTGAHRAASETLVAEGARGRLRTDPSRPTDTVIQGGEGPMAIQWVTPEVRGNLEGNPDLNVTRLDGMFGERPDGSVPVTVAYAAPEHVPARMSELVGWVNSELARPGADPVAIAAEAQRRFVSIHPFADANGRMSRLLMDYCLARGGLPPSVVADPNVDTHLSLPEWTQQVRDGLTVPFEATQQAWARAQARAEAAHPTFAPEPVARATGFAETFATSGEGRTTAQGAELYALAGGGRTDPVSGLGNAADIAPTIDRAAAHVASTGEPAVVVRGSIRNLGGLNGRLGHAQSDAVVADMGRIMREELGRIPGARVDGFRSGPDYTFVVTGREIPQARVDQAMARARARIGELVRARGLDAVDHPKHPGEAAWRGVGLSTASRRVVGGDTATSVSRELANSIERYDRGLGQIRTVPASSTGGSVARPLSFHEVPPPADGPPARAPQRPEGTPRFQSEEQVRRATFEARARELGVTDAAAIERLYLEAAGPIADSVTGYGLAADRAPTMERALSYAEAHGESAHYVEIDIRNLGGLTEGVGRGPADADFGVAAQLIREELGAVGADVHLFRHGGDELSAVVTGPEVTAPQIEAALARAQQRFEAYAQARGINEIPHPKHPDDPSRRGVGFTYGVATAQPHEATGTLFDRAGLIVEQRKVAGGDDPSDARLERLGLAGVPIGELATRLDRELDENQRRVDQAATSSARRRTTGVR